MLSRAPPAAAPSSSSAPPPPPLRLVPPLQSPDLASPHAAVIAAHHRRGSSYPTIVDRHPGDGYRHQRQDSSPSIASPNSNSTTSTTQRRENTFSAPRPSLLPYQEYHSGFSEEDLHQSLQGSPYSSTTSRSLSPSKQHTRHQSFSNFLPRALQSRTPSPTRKTPTTAVATGAYPVSTADDSMPFTGDGRPAPRVADSPGSGFAGWLGTASSSRSVRGMSVSGSDLGIQQQPPSRTDSRQTTPDVTPRKPGAPVTTGMTSTTTATVGDPTTPRNSVSTTASRFMSALSNRLSLPHNPNAASAVDETDELCTLHIESALFPSSFPPSSTTASVSSPTDRDTFSPAAYKNLQLNATGLLARFQAAYRHKTVALRELEAERAAERDELEEAVVRATHLKMQLEGMATRAGEQERAMRELMGELMAEKRARQEERAARERMALGGAEQQQEEMAGDYAEDGEGHGHGRKTWRKSLAGTVKSEDLSSVDTDEESSSRSVSVSLSLDEMSVFSRSRSPTIAPSTVEGSMVDGPTSTAAVTSKGGLLLLTPSSGRARNAPPPMSTFQKIIKGVVGGDNDGAAGDACRNCKGKDASVAWDTVGLLRDENRHLKHRVGQLEVAVEGALDLVNGLGA